MLVEVHLADEKVKLVSRKGNLQEIDSVCVCVCVCVCGVYVCMCVCAGVCVRERGRN